mmetsp:Transcript_3235/g.3170  ORF Transcript_3235/g.3170 Transcript_3235/m.3170 type:complete len:126 (-) Transcript_3235:1655-2032(-)
MASKRLLRSKTQMFGKHKEAVLYQSQLIDNNNQIIVNIRDRPNTIEGALVQSQVLIMDSSTNQNRSIASNSQERAQSASGLSKGNRRDSSDDARGKILVSDVRKALESQSRSDKKRDNVLNGMEL